MDNHLNRYKFYLIQEIKSKKDISYNDARKLVDSFVETKEGVSGFTAWRIMDLKKNPGVKNIMRFGDKPFLDDAYDELNPVRPEIDYL